MSDGTTLNDVYCPRIHRSNARDVAADAADMTTYLRDRILIMAAMTPMNINTGDGEESWDFYIQREVSEILTEMREQWWRDFCAQYILDNQANVVDDYDKQQEVSQ